MTSWFNTRHVQVVMGAAIARGTTSLATLVVAVFIARHFSAYVLGVFALAQGILLFVSTLARRGFETSLLGEFGRTGNAQAISGFACEAFRVVLATGAAYAIAIFLLKGQLERVFGFSGLGEIIGGFAIAVPAHAASYVLSSVMKSMGRPAAASLLENGAVMLVALILMILVAGIDSLSLRNVGLSLAAAAWGVLAWGLYSVRGVLWSGRPGKKVELSAFYQSSRSYLVANLSTAMQAYVLVALCAYFIEPAQLGWLKAAEQLALVLTFVQIVMNNVTPPFIARRIAAGDKEGLQRVVRVSAATSLLACLPVAALFLLAPEKMLSLYGPEYAEGARLLQVFTVAQIFNVWCGSVMLLLNIGGLHRQVMRIAVASAVVSVILTCVFANGFGVFGASLAIGACIVGKNAAAAWVVWRNLGVRAL